MWKEQLAALCDEYSKLDRATSESGDGPLVLHWGFIGGSIGLLNREILMATALRMRGARPRIVLCDALCSGCQIRTYSPDDSIDNWKRVCANCVEVGRRMVDAAGLESIALSSLVSPELVCEARQQADTLPFEDLQNWVIGDYSLGLYAMSSTIRYFRALPTAIPPEQLENVFREFMYTALISLHASQAALSDWQPDVFATTHNIYSEWGPACQTFIKAGTPVYRHIASILQNHVMVRRSDGTHTGHPYYCDDDRWERLASSPLTQKEDVELDAFMDMLGKGSNSQLEYFGEAPQKPEALRERFAIPDGKKVWGIFCPLPWDAHLSADPLLFSDVDEWLVETVRCAAAIKDVIWLVKMHPAESVRDSRISMMEVLSEAFPELPDNIRVITGDERINTHGLIRILDGGITTRGTTGLELALNGKQAMASGSSHYGFKGFTLDSETVDEYFANMRRAPELGPLSREQHELARRYAHDFFVCRNLPFTVYDSKSMRVNEEAFKELLSDAPSVLGNICDGMLQGGSGVFERPGNSPIVHGHPGGESVDDKA